MKFSIIIPSYNQEQFITATLENIVQLKKKGKELGVEVEALLFDSCSNEKVQEQIKKYQSHLDFVEIKKDKGQYDAINKGVERLTGDYWTWLNTDDLIDVNGFECVVKKISERPEIDYIYGNIKTIDDNDQQIAVAIAKELSLEELINKDPGIYQPGSFFKTSFTKSIGLLKPYNCCFDYEYILRILKNGGKLYYINEVVAWFRLHPDSKTKSIVPNFVKDQLVISKEYGRGFFSKHTLVGNLRLMKYKFV
jgi:glycosyltransferase involved in cell wall biosynthesis